LTLDSQLRRAAELAPDHTAIVDGERRATFAELDAAAERLAGGLRAHGVRPGDRVALLMPNCLEAAVAIYGAARARAAFVPVNPTTKEAPPRSSATRR
jgi:acyl-CoA synthetase (AMP-forming)/AMP-acid ligase II